MKDFYEKIKRIPVLISLIYLIFQVLLPWGAEATWSDPIFWIPFLLFVNLALLIFVLSLAFALYERAWSLILPLVCLFALIIYLFAPALQSVTGNLLLLILPQAFLAWPQRKKSSELESSPSTRRG